MARGKEVSEQLRTEWDKRLGGVTSLAGLRTLVATTVRDRGERNALNTYMSDPSPSIIDGLSLLLLRSRAEIVQGVSDNRASTILGQLRNFAFVRHSVSGLHSQIATASGAVIQPLVEVALETVRDGGQVNIRGLGPTALSADEVKGWKDTVEGLRGEYGSEAFDWALAHDAHRDQIDQVLGGVLPPGVFTATIGDHSAYIGP